MTEKKRIFVNIAATYGRSLYALAIGLFCGRWALMALGEADYGLFGLIAGLAGFVSVVNSLMGAAAERFLAGAVGAGDGDEARRWFNSALAVHGILSVVLVAVGYPLGLSFIEHGLVIPPGKMESCVWVWRLCCLSCFVSMAAVPFNALFTARQTLVEVAVYNVIGSTAMVAVLGVFVASPGDWLIGYAILVACVSSFPFVMMTIRSFMRFEECRVKVDELMDLGRVRRLMSFAVRRSCAIIGNLIAVQGRSVLVNRFLGLPFNASIVSSVNLSTHANAAATSVSTAFWPAVATAAGASDMSAVSRLSMCASRLCVFASLVFLVPLSLELDEVFRLWLENPPPGVSLMAASMIAAIVLTRMTEGHWMAFVATGRRIGAYSSAIGCCELAGLFVAVVMFLMDFGIWSVVCSVFLTQVFALFLRLVMGQFVLGFSVHDWARSVFLPSLAVIAGAMAVGFLPRLAMDASLLRVAVVTVVCEAAIIPLAWKFLLAEGERAWLRGKVKSVLGLHDLPLSYRIKPSLRSLLFEFALNVVYPYGNPSRYTDMWCIYLVSLLECGKSGRFCGVLARYCAKGGPKGAFAEYFRLAEAVDAHGCGDEEIKHSADVWKRLEESHRSGTFERFVSGKSVAVVGNGPQEKGRKLGAEIDSHDVVIRINNYAIDGLEEDYGRRTDVWVKNTTPEMKHVLPSDDISLVVYSDDWSRERLRLDYRSHIESDLDNPRIEVDYCSVKDRGGISKYVEALPTVGAIVVERLRRSDAASVDLYGFCAVEVAAGRADGSEEYERVPKDVPRDRFLEEASYHDFPSEMRYLASLISGRRVKKERRDSVGTLTAKHTENA